MRLRLRLHITKKLMIIVAALVLLGMAMGAVYFKDAHADPLPQEVKSKVDYKVIYPASGKTKIESGYIYIEDEKVLRYNVGFEGKTIVFTQQPAPDNLGTGDNVYYPALGVRPYAQFQTKLGPVALSKFWQTETLKPVGQSGILVSGGTMLTAHSSKDLTNQEWKELFDNLKITK